jgi:glycosyltransferase involved in cell wall biosynthesis
MIRVSLSNRRLSVLHIFKIYYPDLFGGTLSVIRDICAGLKDKFDCGVLVCSKSGGQPRIVVNDVSVERVRSFGDVLSLPFAPTYPLWLWRRMAKHDLLALHSPFPLADLVLALGIGRKRPLVVHWHADIVTHAAFRRFVEPLMRRTLRRAEAIIVSDAVLVKETPLLREFGDKCHVVPFGIDLSKYDGPAPRDPDIKAGHDRGRLVFACGRLVPYKGFDVLVRAAVGLRFEVWIVGEGCERPRLEQLIQSLGVGDRVRLLGSVADSELAKLMNLADVFVMPSVTTAETFGLAQLESYGGRSSHHQHVTGHSCSACCAARDRGDHCAARRPGKAGGSDRNADPRSRAARTDGPGRAAACDDKIFHGQFPRGNPDDLSSRCSQEG